MNILIACEYSGIVRRAFVNKGHNVTSCDLLPTEMSCYWATEHHYQGDVTGLILNQYAWNWDMIIAFPPCTHLAVSGARWFKDKQRDGRQQSAINFFMLFANSLCSKVAIENPIGIMSNIYRKPDQIIQPWMFGHGETKSTCLWLKNLPKLIPTNIVDGRIPRIHHMPPSKDRGKLRSKTYQGIADAMAEQWG